MARKEKLIEKAQKYIQKGYLDRAINEYKSAFDQDPRDISIRLRLGDLYVKTSRQEDAVREYTEAAKANTQRGFYLKAIAVYKQVLKLDESNIEVHYKLAELYTKQRLIADAISEYSYIVGTLEKKGKVDEVLDLLKKMVDIDPENVGVRLKLAENYQKKGFDQDALAEYTWIFGKLMERGKLDRAEKIYQALVKNNPTEPVLLEGLTELYRQKEEGPSFVRFAKPLVEVYREAGKMDEARALVEEIAGINPEAAEELGFVSALGEEIGGEEAPEKAPEETAEAAEEAAEEAAPSVEASAEAVEEPEEEAPQPEAPAPEMESAPSVEAAEEEAGEQEVELEEEAVDEDLDVVVEGFDEEEAEEGPAEPVFAAEDQGGAEEDFVEMDLPGAEEETSEELKAASEALDQARSAEAVEAPEAEELIEEEPQAVEEVAEEEAASEPEEVEEPVAEVEEPGEVEEPVAAVEEAAEEPIQAEEPEEVEEPEAAVEEAIEEEAPEAEEPAASVEEAVTEEVSVAEEPVEAEEPAAEIEEAEEVEEPIAAVEEAIEEEAPVAEEPEAQVEEAEEVVAEVEEPGEVEEPVAAVEEAAEEPIQAEEPEEVEEPIAAVEEAIEEEAPEAEEPQAEAEEPAASVEEAVTEEVSVAEEPVEAEEPADEIEEPEEVEEPIAAVEEAVEEEAPVAEEPEAQVEEAEEVEEPIAAAEEAAPVEPPAAVEEPIEPAELAEEEQAPAEAPAAAREAEPVDERAERELSDAITELMEKIEPEEHLLDSGKVAAEETEEAEKENFADLSAELGIDETLQNLAESWGTGEDSKESFDEFKNGIGQQLSREDAETHYNLGIAYMEMELYTEAAKEFKIALRDPNREFDCYSRLGLCSMREDNPGEAVVYYLKGLKVSGRSDEERRGMMYELALAYEASDETEEAAELYSSIYESDPEYREVSEKVDKYGLRTSTIPRPDGMIEVELL